jgi:hypothetical protein
MRAKFRKDSDAPKEPTSKTAREEPIRDIPISDSDDDIRANVRKDKEAPNAKKSSTDTAAPNLANPRIESEAPT